MSSDALPTTATRRRDDPPPLWYRVLDRFGLPTLFACALLWNVLSNGRQDRQERVELLGKLTAAIEAQTSALHELAGEERSHASAVASALRVKP